MKIGTNLEFEIDSNILNNAVQKAIASTYKSSDMAEKLQSYGKQKISAAVTKMREDGSLVHSIAKQIAKEIDPTSVLLLLDVEDIKKQIIDRVTNHLIKTIKL